nr:MAG TPA: hypothetical protein [Caudoviricetes sp.]
MRYPRRKDRSNCKGSMSDLGRTQREFCPAGA